MTAEEKKHFDLDPAYMNDIYIMNADGTNLKRLTTAKGYDGALPHTKMCALMDGCKASGFVVITKDGKVVKLDAKGNELAVKALEATSKEDNLTVARKVTRTL